MLPFLIGHVVPEGEPAWQVLMDLKDIVELVVSPVHTDESISYLEIKISEHRPSTKNFSPMSNFGQSTIFWSITLRW